MARSRNKNKDASKKKEADPTRWTHAVFAIFGFMGAWVLAHAVEDAWAAIFSFYPQIGRPNPNYSKFIGVGLGLAGTIWAWRKEDYFKFITEVVKEVSQVTWPTRSEVRAATIVVVVITLICSCLLFAMDQFWRASTDWLYTL